MSTVSNYKKLIATATAGIVIPLAAILLAGPANASTHAFEPPDPCAAKCGTVHPALNPQPLPPGRAQIPAFLPMRAGAGA